MSKVSADKAFDRAVDLIINQDQLIQNWTGRYITIQGGLAFAEATLLGWKGPDYSLLIALIASLLAVFGGVSAWLISTIIQREYEWQTVYVQAVQRAEGKSPFIYTVKGGSGPGFIARVFIWLKWILIVIWLIVLIVMVIEFANRSFVAP